MHPAGYPAEQLSGQERGLHDGCAFGRGRFLLVMANRSGRTWVMAIALAGLLARIML
jgi:hypothetical protein